MLLSPRLLESAFGTWKRYRGLSAPMTSCVFVILWLPLLPLLVSGSPLSEKLITKSRATAGERPDDKTKSHVCVKLDEF